MSRSGWLRPAVAATAAGGGVVAVGALTAAIFTAQIAIARRAIPLVEAPPPRSCGRYGRRDDEGEPVRLALLGDSAAAGYGVEESAHTLGAQLARGLARQLRRPVLLRCFAVIGARSAHLQPQVEQAIEFMPDMAVVVIGGNDVTNGANSHEAAAHLRRAVRQLRAADAEVVVATCPDLGSVKPIRAPLRWLVSRKSRQLAAKQTMIVVEAGGRTVSLADLLHNLFKAEPHRMFTRDRFHPSADGYDAAASAILPTMLAGFVETAGMAGSVPELRSEEGVRTLREAAARAVTRAGTEVTPASVGGRSEGPSGTWANLRHRAAVPIEPAELAVAA